MALVESLAQGTPVVAPRAEGPAEILRAAPGAHFFKPGDVASLTDAIRLASQTDVDTRRRGQQFCRRFEWDALAETSLLYYEIRRLWSA